MITKLSCFFCFFFKNHLLHGVTGPFLRNLKNVSIRFRHEPCVSVSCFGFNKTTKEKKQKKQSLCFTTKDLHAFLFFPVSVKVSTQTTYWLIFIKKKNCTKQPTGWENDNIMCSFTIGYTCYKEGRKEVHEGVF